MIPSWHLDVFTLIPGVEKVHMSGRSQGPCWNCHSFWCFDDVYGNVTAACQEAAVPTVVGRDRVVSIPLESVRNSGGRRARIMVGGDGRRPAIVGPVHRELHGAAEGVACPVVHGCREGDGTTVR